MAALRIMIIRHAEKPTDDGQAQGVTLAGALDPDDLSVRGWQRAGALATRFDRDGLPRPEWLFAPGVTERYRSTRAMHTLQPLAALRDRVISTRFTVGEETALAEELARRSGWLLVAWEHKSLVALANALVGSDRLTPQRWPDDRFDLVWILRRKRGSWTFRQVGQSLLDGDSDAPIDIDV